MNKHLSNKVIVFTAAMSIAVAVLIFFLGVTTAGKRNLALHSAVVVSVIEKDGNHCISNTVLRLYREQVNQC